MAVRTSARHRSIHARNLIATGLSACLALAACGGSSSEPASPEQADDEGRRSSSESESERSESESAPDSEQSAAAKKPACDDGTCTLCGDAQCPVGWYCDESAAGGPACGWLPECAKKPTCACLKRVYSGGCEERDGGFYVKQ